MLEGNLARPKGKLPDQERWYASDNRNMWIGYAVGMLAPSGYDRDAHRIQGARPNNRDMRDTLNQRAMTVSKLPVLLGLP